MRHQAFENKARPKADVKPEPSQALFTSVRRPQGQGTEAVEAYQGAEVCRQVHQSLQLALFVLKGCAVGTLTYPFECVLGRATNKRKLRCSLLASHLVLLVTIALAHRSIRQVSAFQLVPEVGNCVLRALQSSPCSSVQQQRAGPRISAFLLLLLLAELGRLGRCCLLLVLVGLFGWSCSVLLVTRACWSPVGAGGAVLSCLTATRLGPMLWALAAFSVLAGASMESPAKGPSCPSASKLLSSSPGEQSETGICFAIPRRALRY